ncbi:hypothetical protein EDD37DRAFT_431573 [Exophiala viscosa]|uniref:uncharacterized protein n=1 Tax=Exophiala viscosa TaxID=2486360 RepID=UPI00219C6ACE|nr:hypothetical protein EDD37DRAFT_431573 [Exophiala viscosa]
MFELCESSCGMPRSGYEAYFQENGLDPEAASTPYLTAIPSVERSARTFKSGSLLDDQYREAEEILRDSSDDDLLQEPMTRSFDSRKTAADGYDLVFGEHGKQGLAAFHPSPLDTFRLWQIFPDNVNPLVKILHAPSVQQQILDASADLARVPANMEALMFAIYSMAIASITTEECNAFFGSERELLLAQYHAGARQALTNAGLLGSSDLVTLQAFTLYLVRYFQSI